MFRLLSGEHAFRLRREYSSRIDAECKDLFTMLTYKAMYKYLDDSVHAEVLDFPGVITCGTDLDQARRLLANALVDMAETNLLKGEPLPTPDPNATDPDTDLEEPIHLLLTARLHESLTCQRTSLGETARSAATLAKSPQLTTTARPPESAVP